MKTKLRGVFIVTLLILVTFPLAAKSTVTVEGAGSNRDAALDRALRDAVRQGVGVDIDSLTSLVASDEDEEFREQTVSAASGSVTSYRILSVSNQDGVWRVKIEATVTKKQGTHPTDVSMAEAKVIVVARQMIDGRVDREAEDLKLALEEELLKRNFDLRWALFDKKKVFNPQHDLLAMNIDPTQTDLVIFAESRTSRAGSTNFAEYGIKRERIKTQVKVMAIRPDSLKILALKTGRAMVSSRRMDRAVENSIERALSNISLDFVDSLVRKIVWERNNGRIFQLFLGGAKLDSDKLLQFVQLIGALPGVLKTIPRHRSRNRTLVDILTYLGPSALMQTIQPLLQELNLQLSGFQGHSLVFAPYTGKARLFLDSIPQGADVKIDLVPLGTTPLLTEVEPGERRVNFSCLGFHDTNTLVHAPRGKTLRVLAELEALEIKKPETGFVELTSVPSGAVVRNSSGQVLGKTPMMNLKLPLGSHLLFFSHPTCLDKQQKILVEAKRTSYQIELIKNIDLAKKFKNSLQNKTRSHLIERARDLYIQGEYNQAVRALKLLIETDAKVYEAYGLLGKIQEYELGNLEEAADNYNEWYYTYRDVVKPADRDEKLLEKMKTARARIRRKIKESKSVNK